MKIVNGVKILLALLMGMTTLGGCTSKISDSSSSSSVTMSLDEFLSMYGGSSSASEEEEEQEKVTATFKNYDDEILYITEVIKGDTVEYKGETPIRPSDERVRQYTFIGWDKPLNDLMVDTEFIAQYLEDLNTFTVEFKNYDDTLLYTDMVEYGGTAEYEGDTPTKPGNERVKVYTFTGWDNEEELKNVTSNRKVTAQYSEEINTFTIEFRNYDDSLLYTDTVEYGGTAEYKGDIPTRPGDEQVETYIFSGWDIEDQLSNVTSNLVAKAKFIPYNVDLETLNITYTLDKNNHTYTVTSIKDKQVTKIVIPEYLIIDNVIYKLSKIGNSAFKNCTGLGILTIPSSVKSIGNGAFSGCSFLQRINYAGTISQWASIDFEDKDANPLSNGKAKLYIDGELFQEENIVLKGIDEIGNYAFYNCNFIKTITIPSSVTSIGSYAFDGCSSLISITIPSNITSIGGYAFSGCTQLQIVNIEPNSKLKSIGYHAFSECSSLTSIIIPNSVTSIGECAFSGCTQLQIVNIEPNSKLKSIGESAFFGCNSLERINYEETISDWASINFGDQYANPLSNVKAKLYINGELFQEENIVLEGIEKIGTYAFAGCDFIKTITISSSVTSIGRYAFSNCSFIKTITIPSSVTRIGKSAFFGCNSLESLTLPFIDTYLGYYFGATTYEDNSHYVPESLKTIIILGGTTIPEYAFYGCSSLTSITIPNSATSIGERAFYNCSTLTTIIIPNSVTSIGNSAFYNCSSLESITIPSSVTNIGNSAFSSCSSLTNITIPDSVTSIGNYAFYGCSSLESITIPSSATSIGSDAFSYCSSLESITIPSSVTSIGSNAFRYCTQLQSVTFEPNSKLESIGEDAFSNCISLESITIPSSVTNIGNGAFGNGAFYKCIKLQSVTFEPNSKLESIGSNAFSNCISLESITIPSSVTSIGYHAFSNCSSLESITIPSSITSIGEFAFYKCTKLQSVTFEPNSKLESIGGYAFYNCSSLTTITIPNSVTSIGEDAFHYCDQLQSVTFEPNSKLESIGDYAFSGCSSLERVNYEGTISEWASIDFDYVGANPLSMKKLYIDGKLFQEENIVLEGIEKIGTYAFAGCDFIKTITIPSSVTSIGKDAFYRCNSLTIYCEALSTPSGWDSDWNYSNRPVYWGINENNFTEKDGIQYVIIDEEAVVTRYVGTSTNVEIPTTIEINGKTYDVTSIGERAFESCSSLKRIIIPSSITNIRYYAFSNCSSLTIYCEASSKPSDWSDYWNNYGRPVYWGNEWHYENGVPTLN